MGIRTSDDHFYCSVLADSRNLLGNRLTTVEVRYPRLVHSEVLTHRRNSRNSASSRAIPILKMLEDVGSHPFLPIHWGAAQSGMQAYEEISPAKQEIAKAKILAHFAQAAQLVRDLHELGLAKQVANRYVEPWMWITVILSGTSAGWANFFALRCHEKAEPHIRKIAELTRQAIRENKQNVKQLNAGDWHLPLFGFPGDEEISPMDAPKISAARCARVSYLTHNGIRDVQKDLELYDKLVADEPKHASALEHTAMCLQPRHMSERELSEKSGNYEHGWWQLRKMIPREAVNQAESDLM